MRRFATFALALAVIGASACDDDSPNDPSVQPIVFTAQLNSQNEVTATTPNGIANPSEAAGTGTVTISMQLQRDSSGNVTGGGTANFQFVLTGFPNGTVVQAAHIHTGAAGIAGGVRVNTGLTPGTAVTLANGSATINATDATVTAADATAIVANPAAWYFNVHTTLNPAGVVRGQLVRVQ